MKGRTKRRTGWKGYGATRNDKEERREQRRGR
jgi:hypothetical protein